jgi:hypothetical protein
MSKANNEGIFRVVVWYVVAILLLSIYFWVDMTGLRDMVYTADEHRPDWAMAFLVIYAILKYMPFIVGLIMIIVMTFMLLNRK